jgi:hypothetical protein
MNKKERKLSKKEIQRKEHFEKLCTDMEQKGYTAKPTTFGVVKANILAIVIMLPFAILFARIYFLVNHMIEFWISGNKTLLVLWGFFALIIVLAVMHELIHGFTWGIFAKSHFKSIEFGVIWSMLTPYCTCSEPLKKWQYLLGGAMPTLILGFALAAVSAALNSIFLFFLSELMIISGGGDFLIILKMLLYLSGGADTVYYDHPTECGFVVFEKNK